MILVPISDVEVLRYWVGKCLIGCAISDVSLWLTLSPGSIQKKKHPHRLGWLSCENLRREAEAT